MGRWGMKRGVYVALLRAFGGPTQAFAQQVAEGAVIARHRDPPLEYVLQRVRGG